MKKKLLIPICAIICVLLCSCGTEQGEVDMETSSPTEVRTISVTFVNEVKEADIWILPQTEENLNTSLWGTPTFSKMKAGDSRKGAVSFADSGRYILRIIDTDSGYYSANDLVLGDDLTVVFSTSDTKYEATVVILDENGDQSAQTDTVFVGVL